GIGLFMGSLAVANWLLFLFGATSSDPGVLLVGLMGIGGTYASRRVFCIPDRDRLMVRQSLRPGRRLMPGSWRSLLWLCVRQGRVQLYITLAGAFILGLAIPKAPLILWPAGTMILGLACGLAVFGYEQTGEQNGFLAAQRFPAGRLWTV